MKVENIALNSTPLEIRLNQDGTRQFSLPDRVVTLPKKAIVGLSKELVELSTGEAGEVKHFVQEPPVKFSTSEPVCLRAGVVYENRVTGDDPRFMGIEALIDAFGNHTPPELPKLIAFAKEELGWKIEREVFKVLAQAQLGLTGK